MTFKGRIPEKGSSQWKRNEKTIAENPTLRKLRDQSQGFSGTSQGTGGWTPSEAYKANYDAIFGKKDREDRNE